MGELGGPGREQSPWAPLSLHQEKFGYKPEGGGAWIPKTQCPDVGTTEPWLHSWLRGFRGG